MIDFKSTLKIALKSLEVNKMRSALTSLGIIIGVSAVIIMLAIGEGSKQRIAQEIESIFYQEIKGSSMMNRLPLFILLSQWM